MNYCPTCGGSVSGTAAFCENCGAPLTAPSAPAYGATRRDDTLCTVAKVFLILGCVSIGWAIVPLAWCIPITVSIFRKLNSGEAIGTGLKVCTLLFVNLVAGILLLCMED